MKTNIGKLMDMTETIFNGAGVIYGIEYIKSILGCIILIINITIILIRSFAKIKDKIKSKDINGIVEELNKTKDELNSLKEDDNNE